MKQLSYLTLAVGLSCAVGCATIHEGDKAKPLSGDFDSELVISAKQLNNSADEPFEVVAVTLENQSDHWVRIDKVNLLIDEEAAKSVSVVLGKDLIDWASAKQARQEMDRYNDSLAKGSLMAAGAVAAAVGSGQRNMGLAAAGVGAYGAGAGWAVYDAMSYSHSRVVDPKTTPDNHLFTPFSVPGKGFLRRWIVLNVPLGKRAGRIPIEICYVDGRKERRMMSVQ